MSDRDRSNWESWMTRLPIENSDRLKELGKMLFNAKLISKNDKYNVNRYSLLFLQQYLERKYAEAMAKIESKA